MPDKYVVAEGSGWRSLDIPPEVMAEWRVGTVLSVGSEERLVTRVEDVGAIRRFHLVRTEKLEKEQT